MKPVTRLSLLAPICFFLVSGCAASVQGTAKAPVKQTTQAVADEDTDVVVPYFDSAPPGSMDVAWTPSAPPPQKQAKPLKNHAQPHFISNKGTKGRLFVLPTSFEH